jgi:hypothetical protein
MSASESVREELDTLRRVWSEVSRATSTIQASAEVLQQVGRGEDAADLWLASAECLRVQSRLADRVWAITEAGGP